MPVIAGDSKIPYRWYLKWIGTYSVREKKIRLLRLVWSRKGGPRNAGTGWSAKLSLSLVPRLFAFHKDRFDLYFTLLFVQIHKQRHWGGWCC